jgi:hypothetical protein
LLSLWLAKLIMEESIMRGAYIFRGGYFFISLYLVLFNYLNPDFLFKTMFICEKK